MFPHVWFSCVTYCSGIVPKTRFTMSAEKKASAAAHSGYWPRLYHNVNWFVKFCVCWIVWSQAVDSIKFVVLWNFLRLAFGCLRLSPRHKPQFDLVRNCSFFLHVTLSANIWPPFFNQPVRALSAFFPLLCILCEIFIPSHTYEWEGLRKVHMVHWKTTNISMLWAKSVPHIFLSQFDCRDSTRRH